MDSMRALLARHSRRSAAVAAGACRRQRGEAAGDWLVIGCCGAESACLFGFGCSMCEVDAVSYAEVVLAFPAHG